MTIPATSESREYVLAAGQLHHDLLTGHGTTVAQASKLGPLVGLIVNGGAWQSPTQLHEFLLALINDLNSRHVPTRRNIDMPTMIEVANRVWGVSHYPESRRSVARSMRLSEAGVRNYLDEVAAACNPFSLMKMASSSAVLPSAPYRLWSGKPAEWCTESLVGTARETLAAQELQLELGVVKQLLQRATLTWLDAYFLPHTAHPNVWGYYYHHLRLAWEEDDPFWPRGGTGPREGSAPGGRSIYHLAVAAASQVGCELAARDFRLLVRARNDRFAVRDFLNGVVIAAARNPRASLVISSGMQGRMLGAVLANEKQAANSLGRVSALDLLSSIEADLVDTPVVGLVTLAIAIRSAGTSEKHALIQHYLTARRKIDLSKAGKSDEDAIAWADQSVGWDSTTSLSSFANAFTRARIDNPLKVGHPGFETLLQRDQSMRANKRGDWWRALVLAANGIQRLRSVNEQGVIDGVEAFETLQQHALSLAGLFTRLGEGALTRYPSRSGYGLTNSIRWSCHFSAIASDQVARLSAGPSLPEMKRDTNRISTTRWQIQSRIVRIRSLLVAVTGLASGIVTTRGLTEKGDDRVFAIGPPLPYNSKGLVEELSIELESSYRSLICRSEIIDGDRPAIAQIALWYLFLTRCKLPTPSADELAPRLRVDGYLLADPDDEVARICGYSSVQPHLPTRVLVEFGFDALILGRINVKSRVAQTFDDRSGGNYQFWRAQDAPSIDEHFGHPSVRG